MLIMSVNGAPGVKAGSVTDGTIMKWADLLLWTSSNGSQWALHYHVTEIIHLPFTRDAINAFYKKKPAAHALG